MGKRILIWLVLAVSGWAAEVVPFMDANGVRYRDVKFGPVNQDKIVIFHNRGVTTLPIASLPEEYQQRFPVKPVADALPIPREVVEPPAAPVVVSQPPPSAPASPASILEAMRQKKSEPGNSGGGNSDWARYTRERGTVVLLDGKLVEKSTLTPLIGFLDRERMQVNDGTRMIPGALLNLAVRKNEDDNVAAAMELRPSLWRRSDEQVFLANYKPMTLPGALMKVYAVEADPVDEWRTFKVGTEPSFEDWKRLRR